jgi:hypothetical protein
LPIKVAEHCEQHRELVEQGNTGKGQRRSVSVAGRIVGHPLTGCGLIYFPAHSTTVGAGMQDNAGSLEPRFVGWDPVRCHPEIASVAEIGAEGLLGTASQIAVLYGRQLEDSLSPPCTGNRAADGTGTGAGPSVRVGPLDVEIDDGQPPYRDEYADESRITHHTPDQGRGTGRVGQTTG